MHRLIAAAILLLGLAAPAFANPDFELGPAIGTTAPSIGALQDIAGTPRPLESLMGEKGVVLFFYRSAGWCPFCQAQLMELSKGAAEMEKRGYHLAGISYEPPAVNVKFSEEHNIHLTLLSDPGSTVIDRFGLRDPQYKPGSRAFGVPRPIIMVLDRKGVVKAKLYEAVYQSRPPLPLVLETLDKVAAGR